MLNTQLNDLPFDSQGLHFNLLDDRGICLLNILLSLALTKVLKEAFFGAGPARGNQGAAGVSFSPGRLNNFLCSSRTGALREIGLSGRASREVMLLTRQDDRRIVIKLKEDTRYEEENSKAIRGQGGG